jgi:hypothetical protein
MLLILDHYLKDFSFYIWDSDDFEGGIREF